MFKKGLKPQTHLIIDLVQFVLMGWLAFTAVSMVHFELEGRQHEQFRFELSHVITGGCLCLLVAFHVLFHLPWIRAQLPRLFRGEPERPVHGGQ